MKLKDFLQATLPTEVDWRFLDPETGNLEVVTLIDGKDVKIVGVQRDWEGARLVLLRAH